MTGLDSLFTTGSFFPTHRLSPIRFDLLPNIYKGVTDLNPQLGHLSKGGVSSRTRQALVSGDEFPRLEGSTPRVEKDLGGGEGLPARLLGEPREGLGVI